MSDLTRNELDAKLEAIEARMDGRVASIQGEIQAFLAAQRERDKTIALMMEQSREAANRAETAIERAEAATTTAVASAASVKNNYWAAVAVQLLSVAAILVAAYFANQTSVIGIGQLMKAEPSPPPAEIRIEHVAPSPALSPQDNSSE